MTDSTEHTGIMIPAKVLGAVSFCVADRDVRYFLNGVCLKRNGKRTHVVATNGHMMLKVNVDAELPESAGDEKILRFTGDQVKALRKVSNANVPVIVRFHDLPEQTADLEVGSQCWIRSVEVIDGRFPDYERVIPSAPIDPPEDTPPAFQASYIHAFTRMAKALHVGDSSNSAETMRFRLSNAGSTVIEFPSTKDVDAVGVIMPVRV